MLLNARKGPSSRSPFTDGSHGMDLYSVFDRSIFQFELLETRPESIAQLLPHSTLVDVGKLLNGEKDFDTTALDRSQNTDNALRFVTHIISDDLHSINLDCSLYEKARNGMSNFSTF